MSNGMQKRFTIRLSLLLLIGAFQSKNRYTAMRDFHSGPIRSRLSFFLKSVRVHLRVSQSSLWGGRSLTWAGGVVLEQKTAKIMYHSGGAAEKCFPCFPAPTLSMPTGTNTYQLHEVPVYQVFAIKSTTTQLRANAPPRLSVTTLRG